MSSKIFACTAAVLLCCLVTTTLAVRDVWHPENIEDMRPEAREWYETGVANAEEGLADFGPISAAIANGENANAALKAHMESVLAHVIDANQNTMELVPNLIYLVESFVEWTRDPSLADKAKLKAAVWYVKDKRDDKSYFLQNGAGFWFKLRLDNYLRKIENPNEAVLTLIEEFAALQESVLLARDTLDNAAQIHVEGIALLVPLVDDIDLNLRQIQAVVDWLKVETDNRAGDVLAKSELSVIDVQSKYDSLGNSKRVHISKRPSSMVA